LIKNCGILLEPQENMNIEALIDSAKYVEKLGFGFLFRSDHLQSLSAKKSFAETPECWTSLTALTLSTSTIKLGSLVSPIAFRNPALLVKMSCTLQALSGGRVVLGIGAGWNEDEYSAFGYSFPPFSVRKAQLGEALRIISPLCRGERVDYDGKYFSAHTQFSNSKIHLIVGAKNNSIIRMVGDYADEWNAFGLKREEFSNKVDLLGSPRKVLVSRVNNLLIAENRSKLEKQIASFMRFRGEIRTSTDKLTKSLTQKGMIFGTVEEFEAELRGLVEWGIDRFYFQWFDVTDREPLELLANILAKMRTR
jgi:alkanesulfonate monooxygenase SsuD/methylene tetrahydromethanopterin reductase-like flavin-dependent oxidoreductase (luciferase family)